MAISYPNYKTEINITLKDQITGAPLANQEIEVEFTTEEEGLNLIVNVDWFKLYEELIDLQDPVKQLQVWDKMKKFAFLFQWKISELEEKYEELKERKEKMKVFRDIFRNF